MWPLLLCEAGEREDLFGDREGLAPVRHALQGADQDILRHAQPGKRPTDHRLAEMQRALDDHLQEAAPDLELIGRHERTFDQAHTIFKIAFCRTWQFAAALLAVWLVIVEIAEHMGWSWAR